MNPIFVDTSFVLAFNIPTDGFHVAARRLGHLQTLPLVTTEYVVVEVLDALAGTRHRRAAAAISTMLRQYAMVIPASTALFEAACALYEGRPDKSWGLTDCASFVVMQREGITRALTADRHFQQAGFEALLVD